MPHSIVHRINARTSNQAEIDEERLRQHSIPIAVNDITQSSTDEYNHHLARLSYLSTEQIYVIKDIRRRGKNKVVRFCNERERPNDHRSYMKIAAQNCRKRKASNVGTLFDEVDELKRVRNELEAKKKEYEQQVSTHGSTRPIHVHSSRHRFLTRAISLNTFIVKCCPVDHCHRLSWLNDPVGRSRHYLCI